MVMDVCEMCVWKVNMAALYLQRPCNITHNYTVFNYTCGHPPGGAAGPSVSLIPAVLAALKKLLNRFLILSAGLVV